MLYLVATPIGNLSEITYRAVEVLNSVDYILCEDTRTSLPLLNHYDIKKPLYSYHKFNEQDKSQNVVLDLKNGKNIALISDAGMPGISDPGNVLVNKCIQENLDVTVISGPSAFVNAFVLSGFQPPFMFIGFLPTKSSDIKKLAEKYSNVDSCLIFYVSPHDLDDFYSIINKHFPNRNSCVVREISKMFEEKTFVSANEKYEGVGKGEFVIILDKPIIKEKEFDLDKEILDLINSDISKSELSKTISKKYNLNKNEVYKRVIELSGNK